jgi:FkbH-like protein
VLSIAANFTAEPIEASLTFWLRELGLEMPIEFAPYDQVFQFLLDPESPVGRNAAGLNVVLLKLDAWLAAPAVDAPGADGDPMQTRVTEFADAVRAAADRARSPLLVILTPPSPQVLADPATTQRLRRAERTLIALLQRTPRVELLTFADLTATYPVGDWFDETSHALGQIPYTPAMFTALGTAIARRVRALRVPAYKVLVLDCDNTLWRGVVGEVGADGVIIDAPRRAFHERIVALEAAGMLICLCSKNNEADVLEVFARRRADMPLTLAHVVQHRVNWSPKSANLRELAAQLNLGLDSFVFLDDSAYEVDEVRSQCPGVLALQFPTAPEAIPGFLAHCWALDRPTVTAEDRGRTDAYRAELARTAERHSAQSFDDFLAKLGLEVEIFAPAADDWTRASQMTLRTNQFNVTTIRRSEAELQDFAGRPQAGCRLVRVRDRFGDYGIVGLMLFAADGDLLAVDTFLLSCRALGRRAEHEMLAALGRAAEAQGLRGVRLRFVPTAKNAPARAFLDSLGVVPTDAAGGARHYDLSTAEAIAAPTLTGAEAAANAVAAETTTVAVSTGNALLTLQPIISAELQAVDDVLTRVRGTRPRERAVDRAFVLARDDTERALAEAWCETLGLAQIGIHDDFFASGGDSILAVRMCALVRRSMGAAITPTVLFDAPTIAKLAQRLRGMARDGAATASLVAIQPHGDRPPLFCVHGGAGSVFFYSALARALGPEQPVYGLQARGLYSDDPPCRTVEEMAAFYLSEVRTIQPRGPYQLGGFCLGATIALEMAQQLAARGEQVRYLASFDGRAPGFGKEGDANLTQRAGVPVPLKQRLRGWRQRTYRLKVLGAWTWLTGRALPRRHQRESWYIGVQNLLAERRYRVRPYDGPMHVYTMQGRYATPSLGWEQVVRGPLVVQEVPGEIIHHRALMDPPVVSTLAARIAPSLAAAPLVPATARASETPASVSVVHGS